MSAGSIKTREPIAADAIVMAEARANCAERLRARGKPRVKSRSERNLIVAPVREHSRKPDDQYRKMEALFDGPYAELFSRSGRPGWDVFGDEVGKFDGVLV